MEIFEKRSILFKFKAGEDFTTDIHEVFQGLKSEPNTEIGQKKTLIKVRSPDFSRA
jgi:hypothetical protein